MIEVITIKAGDPKAVAPVFRTWLPGPAGREVLGPVRVFKWDEERKELVEVKGN